MRGGFVWSGEIRDAGGAVFIRSVDVLTQRITPSLAILDKDASRNLVILLPATLDYSYPQIRRKSKYTFIGNVY